MKRPTSPQDAQEVDVKQPKTEQDAGAGEGSSLNTAPASDATPLPPGSGGADALSHTPAGSPPKPSVDAAKRYVRDPALPTAERGTGTTVDQLDTIAKMYADATHLKGWPEDEQDMVLYPYSAELNDKVFIWKGDITTLQVDCIVNAANASLLGGGGVDGAIHAAAGPTLLTECARLGGAKPGETKLTSGHRLAARYVAHTVGPIWANHSSPKRKRESEARLRECYRGTLELCVANEIKSVAFSGVSTGVYGYPVDAAARVACDEVRKFLDSSDGKKIDQVIFCNFRPVDVASYVDNLPSYFPPPRSCAATDDSTKPNLDTDDVKVESDKESTLRAREGEGEGERGSRDGAGAEENPSADDGPIREPVGKGKVPPGKASARKSGKQTHATAAKE